MQLDPSIILQAGRGVTPLLSPAEIQDQQMQREMGTYKLNALRQSSEDDAAYRNVLRSGATPDQIPNKLYAAGLGKQAQEAQKFQADQAKTTREAEKAKFEAAAKQFEIVGQVLGSVKDQASYDAGRQQLQTMGIPTPNAPAQYDPAVVERFFNQALSAKDQAAQKWKEMEYSTPNANAVLQASTSRANNADTVAATTRGQDLKSAAAAAAAQQKVAPKPIPAAALKMQQESLDAIGTAASINADLDAVTKQISDGKLKFGPISNLVNSGLNAVGASTEESRNFASFKANLEKLRNDSLRLNKGVQTDGDAQRAWNELFQNINDTEFVKQRLGEIKRINERAVQLRKLDIDNIRVNYGHEPLDTTPYANQPASLNNGQKDNAAAAPDLAAIEAELRRRGKLK